MVQLPTVWARLLAFAIFCLCFGVVFWYALVHTVHLGTISVPDLTGRSVDEAEQVAHDIGLAVEVEEPGVFSADVERGTIARQEPYAGFHVKTGSTVRVRLSLGGERVVVPQLRGESLQGALRILEQVGLRPGGRAQVMQQSGGDQVIATEPPAGAEVPPTQEVDLLLNVAPAQELWVMPSLLSLPQETVRQFCRNNHLRLGQVHSVTYPGLARGVVVRQYPPAGSPLARSDIITIWVSQ